MSLTQGCEKPELADVNWPDDLRVLIVPERRRQDDRKGRRRRLLSSATN